jgi:hypothetical protein
MNPYSLQKLPKIIHINFPNLSTLKLQGICITTIEGLAFMNAPLLKRLEL